MKKFALVVLIMCLVGTMLTGCSEAQRVSANVSKEADQFNVTRRLVVINSRTDTITLEVIGLFSVQQDYANNEVDIIIETAPNTYKKDFFVVSRDTMYYVEDISGAFVDKYRYEINVLPEMLVPVTFTTSD